ncbi:hypothetical protein NX722_26245 [Endozoicomonas gorgoniicola]|uniref:Uncharacterized protein n=1 Tax=Endozoicomonas gorgoniicola TaxID=1234144 RepID=A0ABT3N366_9GAMM|nr:hypothetical protein [Endozoicomonas gorgoniicola]MCW7556066.1 hypothetical protein [Endozoicomonas gorgoniicola]
MGDRKSKPVQITISGSVVLLNLFILLRRLSVRFIGVTGLQFVVVALSVRRPNRQGADKQRKDDK